MSLACLAMVALSATPGCAYDSFSTVYHFPNIPYTDVENVAIRCNGQLLLSTIGFALDADGTKLRSIS